MNKAHSGTRTRNLKIRSLTRYPIAPYEQNKDFVLLTYTKFRIINICFIMIDDSITIEPDEETELLDRCYQYKCDRRM